MINWKKYKLGELVDYVNGGAWPATAYSENGNGIPVVRVTDIKDFSVDMTSCKYLKNELKNKYIKHQIRTGDLVVCTVGSHPNQQNSVVGKPAVIPSKANGALLNQNAVLLKAKDEYVDKKWLGTFARSLTFKEHVERNARGSANQVRLAISSLLDMEVLLPSREEQTRIASILSSFDDKIELNRRMNATLEQIAATLFKKYFVDDIDPDNLPEGWVISSLADLMDFEGGSQPPASSFISELKENYVRLIQIRDYSTDHHLTFVPISSKLRLCDPKDIMIARYGASVARICFGLKGAYNVALVKVKPKSKHFTEFLRTYLNSDECQDNIIGMSARSVQAGFNKDDFKNIKLPVPAGSELFERYEEIVSKFIDKILANKKENEFLSSLRDTLLPKLISGEIDLSPNNQNEPLHEAILS